MSIRMSKRILSGLLVVTICVAGAGQTERIVSAKTNNLGLNVKKKTLQVNKTFQLKVTCQKKYLKKLTWTSSKKSIAVVKAGTNGKAKVKAKKPGKTNITVGIRGTSKKVVCKVTVKKKSSDTSSNGDSVSDTGQTIAPSSGDTGDNAVTTTTPGTAVPQGSVAPQGTSAPGESTSSDAPSSVQMGTPSTTAPTYEPEPEEDSTEAPASGIEVDRSVLVVEKKLVTQDDGTVVTAYVLNNKYYGPITIRMNGHEYTRTEVCRNFLALLSAGVGDRQNSAGTIRVHRSSKTEYWAVDDLTLQKTYYLRTSTKNKIAPEYADCGTVYILGDVGSEIEITGQALVEE